MNGEPSRLQTRKRTLNIATEMGKQRAPGDNETGGVTKTTRVLRRCARAVPASETNSRVTHIHAEQSLGKDQSQVPERLKPESADRSENGRERRRERHCEEPDVILTISELRGGLASQN